MEGIKVLIGKLEDCRNYAVANKKILSPWYADFKLLQREQALQIDAMPHELACLDEAMLLWVNNMALLQRLDLGKVVGLVVNKNLITDPRAIMVYIEEQNRGDVQGA